VNRGNLSLLEGATGFGSWHHRLHFEKEAGTARAVPTYGFEHQRYRKLLGQKVMAEAWQRLMERTCRQEVGEPDTNLLAGSEPFSNNRGEV
jgi:hypothetical protein